MNVLFLPREFDDYRGSTAMFGKSMHDIEITHLWTKNESSVDEGGFDIIIQRCADCGVTRRILDLDSGPSARSDDSTLEYRKIETVRLAERMKEVGQLLEEQWNELLDGSGYATLNDLIRGIGNKSQGLVDGGNIPFYQLERWVRTTQMYRLTLLVAFKQSLVCNSCDRVFFSIDSLTLDHIDEDRSNARLTNLQLLCEPCHREKTFPGQHDISAYDPRATWCGHVITCVELRGLRECTRS